MGFSRQEYWSGLPCTPPGDLPGPGVEPISLMSSALAGGFFTTSTTKLVLFLVPLWLLVSKPKPDIFLSPTTKPLSVRRSASRHSVQFSRSVVSDSLRPHESQHTRTPCPSPTPGVYPNPCPSSLWCHPAISSSVIPFSSCPQSLPASGSFPMSQLFAWGGQSTRVYSLWRV